MGVIKKHWGGGGGRNKIDPISAYAMPIYMTDLFRWRQPPSPV